MDRTSRLRGRRGRMTSVESTSASRDQAPQLLMRVFAAGWPGLTVLAVFFITLAPTVTGEDSGELITAAYHFGVPHPPGYPLWTVLCGLWMHVIPFGNIAWRANLFSAACTAGAVTFMFLMLRQMGFRQWAAGCAAAVSCLTAAIWSQSVIAEVYALNLLLAAALVWLVAKWDRDQKRLWLMLGALVFGLGMCNHHTIGFAALGVVIWAVIRRPVLLRDWRLLFQCVFLFGIGLLPYVYLPLAARRDAPVNWGEVTTVSAAWEHVSRGQYKSDHPIEAPEPKTLGKLAAQFYYGLQWEVRQFTPVLIPLLVAGLIWLWRRRTRRTQLLWFLLLTACCGPMFLYIGGPVMGRQDEFVQKVFLTPVAMLSAVPLAAGIHWLLAFLRTARPRVGLRVHRLVVATVGVLILGTPVVAHWHENNMRHYWWAYDHAQNILACLLPKAIVFPSGDHNTFPLIYLLHVEGERPDVTIADKYGYIDPSLYQDMPNNPGKPKTKEQREEIESWVIKNSHRPVYYTVKKPSPVDNATCIPVGVTYHLLPEGQTLDSESCWQDIHLRNLDGPYAPEDLAAMNILADHFYAIGVTALETGRNDEAKQAFRTCLDHAWGMKEIHNNVASAMAEADFVDEAIGYYEEAARLDWRYGPARWNLAKIFGTLGRHAWSAKIFEDLTQSTPGDFRPFGELGFLYANHLGNLDLAKFWWYESLRINPHQPQILAALADVNGLYGSRSSGAMKAATDSSGPPNTNGQAPVTTQPVISDPTPSSKTPAGAGRLSVSEEEIDFGQVVEGIPISRELILENVGTEDLILEDIRATCTCAVGELTEKTLAPGAKSVIEVGLKTAGKRGQEKETLTILSNDATRPEFRVVLHAYVVPEMAAEPAELSWSLLPKERPEPFEIAVTNNLDQGFRIKDVKASVGHYEFEWDREKSARSLVIRGHATQGVSADEQGFIEIQTDVAGSEHIRVPVGVKVLSPAKVKPTLVYMGRIRKGQPAQRNVRIEAVREGLPLSLQVAKDAGIPGLKTALHPVDEARSSWELMLTLDAGAMEAGAFKHVVAIQIEGYEKPLEITLYGNVTE